MTYEPKLAAALSGATMGQLAYWRASHGKQAPLLIPEISANRPLLYSFRDLVALRTFMMLRETVSLQSIRKAVNTINEHVDIGHLSELKLAGDKSSIYLVEPGRVTDLVRRPGQQVFAEVIDILRPFIAHGREVPALIHPRPHLRVDNAIRGGEPVIDGTRVPFNDVSELMRDGLDPSEIKEFYPSVGKAAALDALDFADYVDSYQEGQSVRTSVVV